MILLNHLHQNNPAEKFKKSYEVIIEYFYFLNCFIILKNVLNNISGYT